MSAASVEPSRIVVVAGSSGAFPIILKLARGLDRPGDAALFVQYHRAGELEFAFQPFMPPDGFQARQARTDMPVAAGNMYYPRRSDDLEVHDGRLRVCAPWGRAHPNIDRLLGTLAACYGRRLVAVLLSGYQQDGVLGLGDVRAAGGRTLVQDPRDAAVPDLPRNAIAAGVADEVLPTRVLLDRMSALLGSSRLKAVP